MTNTHACLYHRPKQCPDIRHAIKHTHIQINLLLSITQATDELLEHILPNILGLISVLRERWRLMFEVTRRNYLRRTRFGHRLDSYACFMKQANADMAMGWVHPWVGLGWVGLGWHKWVELQ